MRYAAFLFALLLPLSVFAGDVGEGEGDDDEPPARLSPEAIPAVIAEAGVGDWVLYKLADGGTSKLTVVERWEDHGDTYLVIRTEVKGKKKKNAAVDEARILVSESVENLRTLGPEDYIVPGEVLVNGKRVSAVIVHHVDEGKLVRQSYISERVPVYGLARGVEVDGEKRVVAMSLQDFGYGWEEE